MNLMFEALSLTFNSYWHAAIVTLHLTLFLEHFKNNHQIFCHFICKHLSVSSLTEKAFEEMEALYHYDTQQSQRHFFFVFGHPVCIRFPHVVDVSLKFLRFSNCSFSICLLFNAVYLLK